MEKPTLCQLQKHLLNWKLDDALNPPPPPGKRGSYDRCYSPIITVWYLVFQRYNSDPTLEAVVQDARAGGADALAQPHNPPSQKLLSDSTASYNDARQRLSLGVVQAAFAASVRSLTDQQNLGSLDNVQLIDGTLLSMLANDQLRQEYPPASNQHGQSDWSQMRVVAAFSAQHGGITAAAEAATSTSEQALVWNVFSQSAPGQIFVGDRNFGVYSVAQAARHYKHDVIVRLTNKRVLRLIGKQARWGCGQEQILSWSPSEKDQSHGEASAQALTGRLLFLRLERPGFQPVELWLFTTLMDVEKYSAEMLLKLYGIRWQAEINFRYLKTQLKLNEFTSQSPAMVRKELYAALLTYNLIRHGMQGCAKALEVSVAQVSFQKVRRALGNGLTDWIANKTKYIRRLRGLLLPPRSQPRPSEPRVVRRRNQTFPTLRGSRTEARKEASETSAATCHLSSPQDSQQNCATAAKS